jgi:hypothetical protein
MYSSKTARELLWRTVSAKGLDGPMRKSVLQAGPTGTRQQKIEDEVIGRFRWLCELAHRHPCD